jgi:hypothetical protein
MRVVDTSAWLEGLTDSEVWRKVDAGTDLLTCDAHFAALPGVVYFAKDAP